jgi:hypothetical protein
MLADILGLAPEWGFDLLTMQAPYLYKTDCNATLSFGVSAPWDGCSRGLDE